MNPSVILITVIYNNGIRKTAAILSLYHLFSPYSVYTSYLCSFLSNIYVFLYIISVCRFIFIIL